MSKAIKNYYPELPVLAYRKTTIKLPDLEAHAKGLPYTREIKAAIYTIFRFESRNGQSGINNNYCGIQADAGRWDNKFTPLMAGTVIAREGGTGLLRRFVAFKDVDGCLQMLADRVMKYGMYIGGTTSRFIDKQAYPEGFPVQTWADFVMAYKREWVTGDADYRPTVADYEGIGSTYRKGLRLFS